MCGFSPHSQRLIQVIPDLHCGLRCSLPLCEGNLTDRLKKNFFEGVVSIGAVCSEQMIPFLSRIWIKGYQSPSNHDFSILFPMFFCKTSLVFPSFLMLKSMFFCRFFQPKPMVNSPRLGAETPQFRGSTAAAARCWAGSRAPSQPGKPSS